jgi:hypothetical protein
MLGNSAKRMEDRQEQCVGSTIRQFFYYPKMWASYSPEAHTIYALNAIAAVVHLVSAATIIGISATRTPKVVNPNYTPIGPYLPAVCYAPPTAQTRPDFYIEVQDVFTPRNYLQFIVVSFFLLSGVFQMIPVFSKESYIERIKSNGCNNLRYIEYSISASVMIVGLACLVSVYDLFTHLLLFLSTFLCMLLGLAADHVRCLQKQIIDSKVLFLRGTTLLEPTATYDVKTSPIMLYLHNIKWALHVLGWVAILVPYAGVLLIAFFITASRGWDCFEGQIYERTMPDWIYAAIILQLILFSVFGAVQLRQFANDDMPNIGNLTEFHYVFLSLLSKSLLGWLVASNLLFV